MIRSDLIARIAAKNPHLYAMEVEAAVRTILACITDALMAGDRVELRGFGAFSVREMPARQRRNPRNQSEVSVSERRTVVFKVGKVMRARLNSHVSETPDQIVVETLKAD
ncbi:HU family DNA-binding protein [Methylobacterium sp. A54F]